MKNSKKIDLMELFGKGIKQDERQFQKQMVNIHEFYLSGEIESSEEYIQWFDTIRHAGENDVVKIYINSSGGDVFTAIQFMRVLQETAASIVVSIEGICASAATMIMLCGDSFEISDHSVFMFHTYSGGMIGKGHEIHSQAQYEREWSINLIKKVYDGFLSEHEMHRVIDGADLWMNGEEVVKRLEARQKKFAAQDEETLEKKDVNVKKSTRKKAVKQSAEKSERN
jgi:ATP-dependent protease ClpP protease subunit